ncbi:uncharacterized protein LOC126906824 [Daktulosphaira vitifoliae]|uniref:uncharacterized protein LOC126906824 n=1 Tax=Daktulosphaira vitifoliae TaxID=58002 RepID=UPI0021A9DBB3|nr:uncharacterized protein LOC126906824 [Daktulosphaira vitifoliae]
MNYNIFIFILAVNVSSEHKKYDKGYAINFLNSFLQKIKWQILSKTSVYDHLSKSWIHTHKLLINKHNCCKGLIVDKNNVNQKLRETMVLINHEYIRSLDWIIYHVQLIVSDCFLKNYRKTSEDYPHCMSLLLPNIENSIKLISRFISAIHFLMNLLNIKTKPFALDELIKFVGLISRKINENDNAYVNRIHYKFYDEYKVRNCNLINILQNYCIDQSYKIRNYDEYDLNRYIKDNHLSKTFKMYEFIEVTLRNGIEDKEKKFYSNLGFFYDEVKHETSYVYENRKKKFFIYSR